MSEKSVSQDPAYEALIALGYQSLTSEELEKERDDNQSNVLLENILRSKLKEINRIEFRGKEHPFSEENIEVAIQRLKGIDESDGLIEASEKVYDLLTLGVSLPQSIDNERQSHPLQYIDWENLLNNAFHTVKEFSVDTSRGSRKRRLDLVLFVNGIPFVAIECKAPNVEVDEAVGQLITYQYPREIPHFFKYVQILLAINGDFAKYATVGTPRNFWSKWKEDKTDIDEAGLKVAIDKSPEDSLSGQDKTLYNLCRQERLLNLIRWFILFEADGKKVRKIARSHQFFAVNSTMDVVREVNSEGVRESGMIYHTQGSGKSLTMVWLAQKIITDMNIKNQRIIIVTDRKELNNQISKVFHKCGIIPASAKTGTELANLISQKASVITTLVHKFRNAAQHLAVNDDPNIFVLVDESHRTQFGMLSVDMRKTLSKACFIGFSGTPLNKEDRNNFERFGSLIEPSYTVRSAIEEGVILPLLYESRKIEFTQDKDRIDSGFDEIAKGLVKKDKAELKKKYATINKLSELDQVIYLQAADINEHYLLNYKRKNAKAQLVVGKKTIALKYHKYLEEFGDVSSAVVISPPSKSEGEDPVEDSDDMELNNFWGEMMDKYGSEAEYNKKIISDFNDKDKNPEILIVVDKLLTGFDAPINTVMYLCRKLREHKLLQAIARVNRVYEGKDYGYIVDYSGNWDELERAIEEQDNLSGGEAGDLDGVVTPIEEKIADLQTAHQKLLDLFGEDKGKGDQSAYILMLNTPEKRDDFIEKLRYFGQCFSVSIASKKFVDETDKKTIDRYQEDMEWFEKFRQMVKIHYNDGSMDYKEYDSAMKNLLGMYVDVSELTTENLEKEIYGDMGDSSSWVEGEKIAANADKRARELERKIEDIEHTDPVEYKEFSELLEQAIQAFYQSKLPGFETGDYKEYFSEVKRLEAKFTRPDLEQLPTGLEPGSREASFFKSIKQILKEKLSGIEVLDDDVAGMALGMSEILKEYENTVNFWSNHSSQNRTWQKIYAYLYDGVEGLSSDLNYELKSEIIDQVMGIAKSHFESGNN